MELGLALAPGDGENDKVNDSEEGENYTALCDE